MEVYDFEDDSSEEAPDTNDKIAEKLISRHKKLGKLNSKLYTHAWRTT